LKGFEEGSHPRVEQKFDNGFPVERKVINNNEETYGYNITGSEFTEYVRSIGELEISALMTSGVDCAVEEFISLQWNFLPTQCWMQRAPHCDFWWCKGTLR
jgi:hypothetical protein